MQLSVVIPLYNEEESLKELHGLLSKVLQTQGYTYEILLIDDGSTDKSWNQISRLAVTDPHVRGYRFSKNFGKSQALHLGFKEACGEVVMTMDADLQDNPEEIPAFVELITRQNYDLVSGWKRKRYDSFFAKNLPSKLFNWAARKTSGLKLHDFNCGIKAYKNEVVKNVDVFGEMHRYIPVLAKNAGYTKITEKIVQHQSRKYGQTKFGMERFINGFLDLVTIWFLSKFGKRPMHFFGALGVLMFLFGFIAAAYIGGMKIYKLIYLYEPARLVADDPWFYIALTSMILGVQFFLAGFIGEMILRNGKQKERYRVAEKI
ncbi:MAG: glycosyltransferase [Flavobacteriales bacterium CG_4_9_14_3_um_filter_40_17]|nr:MAG: glycosyltransferase [Flavobacteriales bacterium CG_4_9_14_3_um_filter_40_17]